MGLTGIILRATVRLKRVETSRLRVDTDRTANIDDTMEHLSSTDEDYDYTVAWTDCLATRRALGRSLITSASFQTTHEIRFKHLVKHRKRKSPPLHGTPP